MSDIIRNLPPYDTTEDEQYLINNKITMLLYDTQDRYNTFFNDTKAKCNLYTEKGECNHNSQCKYQLRYCEKKECNRDILCNWYVQICEWYNSFVLNDNRFFYNRNK